MPTASATVDARFGLVRAEPDGSLVIAGTAKPGENVQVFADDTLLGEAKAEASGDWVLVPDKAIATGGVELTLGIAGSNARAPQSYVVAIDPARKAAPLVVASEPGQMSKVLQGLASAKLAPAETAVATVATPAPVPGSTAPATVGAVAPKAAPADTPTTTAATSGAALPAAASAPQSAVAAPATTSTAASPSPAPAKPAAGASTQVAIASPNAAPAKPAEEAVPTIAPSIDAIEIEGDKDFFAGNAPDGATVRLYVNDQYIADAVAGGGRWLVEGHGALTQHTQVVRIDVLKAGTAEVLARAEVNFVIDIPAVPAKPQPEAPAVAVAQSRAPLANSPAVEPKAAAAKPVAQATTSAPSVAVPVGTAAEVANVPTPTAQAVNQPSEAVKSVNQGTAAASTNQPIALAAEANRPLVTQGAASVAATGGAAEAVAATEPPVSSWRAPPVELPNDLGMASAAPAAEAAPTVSEATAVPTAAASSVAGTGQAPTAAPAVASTTPASPSAVPPASSPPVAVAENPAARAPNTAPPQQPSTGVAATPVAPAPPASAAAAAAETAGTAGNSLPTLVAEPVGEPGSGRFVSGKAIIRHGDNLWTIAQRVYGSGLRYTTIYQANDEQIRNPHWIYPGQVFDLPKKP
ncbi:MAG: LysM peptidoglycan-binding domain-containing protein [Devosia sp.]|nr:LysM peptidoglycan-binding domain-containing protein [Devosia sp.]